ncbi:hypothetical protein Q5752_001046 [Cryptotrichosporon argae]
MGLFRRSNESERARAGAGSPPTVVTGHTTTTPGHHHHAARDGALAGGLAHHEASSHPTRDGVLAGAAVGEVQHHRNEKELRRENGAGLGHHNNTYGTSGAGTGMGVAGTGQNSLGRDALVADSAAGTGHHGYGTTGTAATTGTHTSPAPMAGMTTTSGANGAKPTLAQAHKLDRKAGLESTAGSLLCSSSLKHKSQVHRAEADHLRMQASELGEAERLEHEAGLRRQRAVGLGADPQHATGTTGFAGAGAGRTAQVA